MLFPLIFPLQFKIQNSNSFKPFFSSYIFSLILSNINFPHSIFLLSLILFFLTFSFIPKHSTTPSLLSYVTTQTFFFIFFFKKITPELFLILFQTLFRINPFLCILHEKIMGFMILNLLLLLSLSRSYL
jgi:hypothetical protein